MKYALALILICATCCSVSRSFADEPTLIFTFEDPAATPNDGFGGSSSVDRSGNLVLIGAPGDSTIGSSVGQAYLFDAVSGNHLHTFDDPTPTGFDNFGSNLAIDGNYALIGAIGDDTNGSGVGQAHLFDTVSGNLLHTFDDPSVTGNDRFGGSVAVDDNYVLIGASGDDTNGPSVGQAHLFDAVSGNLLHTFNDPSVSSFDRFGDSVAIDGNHVLIGASSDDTIGFSVGQAHLFDAVSGNLLHTFNDPTVTDRDRFGTSVAIDGNHVLVGAPNDDTLGLNLGQAHLFDLVSGNLLYTFDNPTSGGSGLFGIVAIDGNHVVVGTFTGTGVNGQGVGQAYLFDAVSGNLLHTFDNAMVPENDNFGAAIAIENNHILIGTAGFVTGVGRVGQVLQFETVPDPVILGDCNQDSVVNFLDIPAFISVLSVDSYLAEADINEDQIVNFLDITPFISLLSL